MFGDLTTSLGKIFDKLTSVGYLREEDVEKALREIRIALLEADVALPVVKEFTKLVKERAVGEKVVQSVSPGQMVIKIVQNCLEEILTLENHELDLSTTPPAVILIAGLQGSGKTTTTAKIAHKLKKEGKKVYLASLDVYRPAAQEQLLTLAQQIEVDCLPIEAAKKPLDITKKALKEAKFYDVLLLDTAGRLHVDAELMKELQQVKKLANPIETLLVADSITGQDAVTIAQEFDKSISLTGIILTRVDSDARGGAALSMSYITKCPIKFLGVGEKISDLENFYPDRIASRILDMGDVVSLVEKAAEIIDKEETEELMKKVEKGRFDLDMLANQMKSMKKMGGISSIMKMIPGIGKLTKNMNSNEMDDSVINKQLAIICSMTKEEKRNPKILNASRKIRIANGSATRAQDINKLVKQFLQMQKMAKKFGKMDKESLMQGGLDKLLQGHENKF
jgi:signal recognition particle subunit SRP54